MILDKPLSGGHVVTTLFQHIRTITSSLKKHSSLALEMCGLIDSTLYTEYRFNVVRPMNEVTLRRARLVLGWVTVFGRVYHHGM